MNSYKYSYANYTAEGRIYTYIVRSSVSLSLSKPLTELCLKTGLQV